MRLTERSKARNNLLLSLAAGLGILVPTALQAVPDPTVRALLMVVVIFSAILLANRTSSVEEVNPPPVDKLPEEPITWPDGKDPRRQKGE